MDNLTIVVPIRSRGQVNSDQQEIRHDGTSRPVTARRRIKVKDPSGGNLRVQWVKVGLPGEGLKIEGSFPLFLNGNNVLCSTDIQAIVPKVIYRVLAIMGIRPTRDERRLIDAGEIKIDRVDVVGWIKTTRLSASVGLVIEALNYGLKASQRPCMYFPRETLVWNATNRNWSLMVYDKAAQLQAKQKAARKRQAKTGDDSDANVWDHLERYARSVAVRYLRVELRVLRNQLQLLEIAEVRQLDSEMLQKWVKERVREMLDDLRHPLPPIPVTDRPITRSLALALLRKIGIDLVGGMNVRARQRAEKQLRDGFNVDRMQQAGLDPEYVRFVSDLTKDGGPLIRFGTLSS
jgi:hypothetical protein